MADKIVLGIDPAMKRDSTAMVAVRVEDGATFLLWLGVAPLDVDSLNRAVDQAFRDYRVMAMGSDVHGGEPFSPLWRAKYAALVTAKALWRYMFNPTIGDHLTRATP